MLDGTFEGWENGRIFRLLDGTHWRQTSFDFSFEFIFAPRVTLVPGTFGFMMFVDGADGSASVEQLTVIADSCISSDFDGFEFGNVYVLCNGQVWEQTSFTFRFRFAYRPQVLLFTTGFGTEMWVEEIDEAVTVEQLTVIADTCISSDFNGFEFGNVYVLCNGQVWEQTSFTFRFHFAYRPQVLILTTGFGTEMWVEGIDETVKVRRIA